uniref:Orn/DAP/Arg decarboxylase 2 N-terminal domain-containing protein n=1 Tax=Anopheles christyi TaxID=43041 RepID=A0A182K2U0_9DIPT
MESPPEQLSVFATSTAELLQHFIATEQHTESSLNILDLDVIVRNYQGWSARFPFAIPYFLPSVNNHSTVLALLTQLGLGFSCASVEEMRAALSSGASPDRIILAHPAKSPDTILYAKQRDIQRIVCDSAQEITKVQRLYPAAKIILRIRLCSTQKFGCCPDNDVRDILHHIKSTETVTIDGIHIAIPQQSDLLLGETLQKAILIGRDAIQLAHMVGLPAIQELVLSGTDNVPSEQLQQMMAELNLNLDVPFPRLIIETERQLVESAVTLLTSVQSKRVIRQGGTAGPIQEIMYFINDGRYGSFEWWNTVDKRPAVIRSNGTVLPPGPTHPTSLWGQSCDSADIVCERIELPELEIGDYLVFPGMGAYGVTLASRFNGFPIPETVVCAGLESTRALIGGTGARWLS